VRNHKSPRRALIDLECTTLSDGQLLKLEAVVQAVAQSDVDSLPPARRRWSDVLLDTIYIIGGWVDPADGKRGRVWWLSMMVVYGLLAAHLVLAGQWKFENLAHGLTMLVVLFLLAFVLGLMAELKRIKHWLMVDNNAQVTLLTGMNSVNSVPESAMKSAQI